MEDIKIWAIIKLYRSIQSKCYVFLRNILLPLHHFERYIPKSGKIADIGSGYGSFSIYCALKNNSRRIIGYELNPKRVREATAAAKKIPNVNFCVKDFRKDASIDNCDCVMMIDLLHHIPGETQRLLIRESYKKLKKGGKLIIKDVSRKPLWKLYYCYLHDAIMTLGKKLYFLELPGFLKMAQETGFKLKTNPKPVKTWFFNPVPHMVMILEK